MRTLRDAYFDEFDKESDTYYIFVVPEFDTALDGYMVRGKGIGFVKSDEDAHTYAHELAHGAFGLEHSFPGIPAGTTNNLLDYTEDGGHLTHEQWYDMQHFTPVFSILDDEEDGSLIIVELDLFELEQLYDFMNSDSSLTFISIGGKPISLKGAITKLVFSTYEDSWFTKDGDGRKTVLLESVPMGCLLAFEINDIYYEAKAAKNTESFAGYKSADSVYTESITYNLESHNTIAGLPAFEGGDFVFKLFLSNIFEENPVSIDSLNQGLGEIHGDNAYMAYMDNANSETAIQLYAHFGTTISDDSKAILYHFIDYDIYGKDAMLALRTAHILGDFPIYASCLSILDRDAHLLAEFHLSDSLADLTLPANFTGVTDETYREVKGYLYDTDGIPDEFSPQTQLAYDTQKSFSSYHLIQFLNGLETYTALAEKMADGVELARYDVTALLHGYDALNGIELSLGDCAMELLNFEARESILSHVSEWSYSDRREDLMVRVIESTPEPQYEQMLALLSTDNCALLDDIWSDTWFSHLDRFIAAISDMAIAVKQAEPGYSGGDLPLIPFYNDGVFWDWSETEYDWDDCQIEFTHDFTLWEGEDYIVHPFDLVRVDLKEDFRFPILGGNGRTLQEGQILVVPAIWAYYILSKQNDVTNLSLLRMAGDAIIILGSGGTAAPFYVYLAAADLIISGFENIIMSNEDYENLQALYHTYDALALVVGGVEGLSQLKWFNKITAGQALSRYSMKSSKLKPLLIASYKQIKKRDEIIELLRTAILGMAGDVLTHLNAPKMRNGLMTALISMELTKNAKSIANAVIRNVQADFIAIELMKPVYGRHTGDILPFANLVKTNIEEVAYHLDDLKWLSLEVTEAEYTSIVEMYAIDYKNKLDVIVNGNLEIVILENGLVRVIEMLGDIPGYHKLAGKSSLSPRSFKKIADELVGADGIKFKYTGQIYHHPRDFLNLTGSDIYDIIFPDGAYAKFDNANGRMLYSINGENFFVRFQSGYPSADVETYMRDKITRMRNCRGMNGVQTIFIEYGALTITTSAHKTTTFIGKLSGTGKMKALFGGFTHIEFGEVPGAVNLLNMPDSYWIGATWFDDFNRDWMQRAIARGDDIYITDDIIENSLYNFDEHDVKYGSYFANELNELVLAKIKPINISIEDWNLLIPDIKLAAGTKKL
ncbi:MAG: hypothetical protein GQ574_28560 [Crocinitomix sp.]|nr:hypothetical protein [Crocinitomix sp.]